MQVRQQITDANLKVVRGYTQKEWPLRFELHRQQRYFARKVKLSNQIWITLLQLPARLFRCRQLLRHNFSGSFKFSPRLGVEI